MKSGMGNVVILAQAFSSATRFLSWNARGLLAAADDLFRRKWSLVLSMLAKCDVLILQETHGDETLCKAAVCAIEHLFHWWFSQGPNKRPGGILTFIRKSACEKMRECSSLDLVQGRVHVIELI